jgi:hypothetical protein
MTESTTNGVKILNIVDAEYNNRTNENTIKCNNVTQFLDKFINKMIGDNKIMSILDKEKITRDILVDNKCKNHISETFKSKYGAYTHFKSIEFGDVSQYSHIRFDRYGTKPIIYIMYA